MPSVEPLPIPLANAVLRRLAASDLPAFQAVRHDPQLGRYQGWSPMSDADALAFIEDMRDAPLLRPGSWSQIAIAEPVNDRLVGDLGLFVSGDNSCAEVGFTLARGAQGRGIATAAVRAAIELVFARTAVTRVLGITDSRNTASVRLLERLGMQRIESRATIYKGEPCTEWVFSKER